MQIKIGNFFLASGDKESPNNLNVQRNSASQVVEGLRWSEAKTFDRLNRKVTVRFSVTRLHDTLADAERFILTHGTSVPTSGLVQFVLSDNSSLWMNASTCVCTPVDSKEIGRTTTHDYSLIGGSILSVKPT